MAYLQGVFPIVKKENLARNVFDLTIHCPTLAKETLAGQFVHIKVNGFQLRRPISICEVDGDKGCLRLVFEIRGGGTEALSKLNEGELIDLLGPLGHGFTLLDSTKKAVVIGGGIGVPPLLETIKSYGKNGTAIIGFRSLSAVILNEDFSAQGTDTILCTDDGTAGRKGFVTEAFSEFLEKEKPDIVYTCGPKPMIKAVAKMSEERGILCEVSLEERMGCGVGACLVCACKTKKNGVEGFSHVCKDGPVFDSREVVL